MLDVPSELWHAWDFCLAAVQQVREMDGEHGGGDELADQLLTDELPSEHQDKIRKKLNL